jgi:hypothetical protein
MGGPSVFFGGSTGRSWFFGIGIDRYRDARIPNLKYAVRDMEGVYERLLKDYDLEEDTRYHILLRNEEATKRAIISTFNDIGRKVQDRDKVLIYFAGHGEVIGKDGYWKPYDTEEGHEDTYIINDYLRKLIGRLQKARHVLVLMDSCYSGSFLAESTRSSDLPVDRREEESSRFAICSGGPKDAVLDNSPFARYLLEKLDKHPEEWLDSQELALRVRNLTLSNHYQMPMVGAIQGTGHRRGAYLFRKKTAEEAFWRNCLKQGTLAAFNQYLDKYPNGPHADEALALIRDLEEQQDWERARRVDKTFAYREFLRSFPQGQFANQARERIRVLQDAEQGRTEDRQWAEAQAADTRRAYEVYLRAYPRGQFAGQAHDRIAQLQRLEQEALREGQIERAWQDAQSRHTITAYEAFLRNYPHHRLAKLAKSRMESLKQEEAARQDARAKQSIPASPKPPPADQGTDRQKKYWPWLAGVAVLVALTIGWAIWGGGGSPDETASQTDATTFEEDKPGLVEEIPPSTLSQDDDEEESPEPALSKSNPAEEQASPPAISRSFSGDVLTVTVREGTPPYDLKILRRGNEVYQESLSQAGSHRITITEYRQDAGTYSIQVTDRNNQIAERSIRIDPPKVVRPSTPSAKKGTATLGGKTYPTVRINGKTWMAQNLDYEVAGSWCYDNDPSNCRKYGRLYTWEAAKRACAAVGWRLPTDAEWRAMAKMYGGADDDASDGGKAAYRVLIQGGSSGFSAQLGGDRDSNGDFYRLGSWGRY